MLSGATFPLAVRMVVSDAALAGVGVGRIAAVNTLGGIVGSLAVGFAALRVAQADAERHDHERRERADRCLRLVALAERGRGRAAIAALASLLAWLAIPRLLPTRVPDDYLADGDRLVAVREGLQSNLAVVRREGVLDLEIDRLRQGQNRKTQQIMAAHLPMLMHEHPRRVVVVGVGAGRRRRAS